MTGKFKKPAHLNALASKRREWKAVGCVSDVSSFRKVLSGAAPVFAVAFCTAFLASSILTPTRTSDATNTVTTNITSGYYYVRISSSDVALNLMPAPSGAMTVVSSTVKTSTNSPSGYKLYLGMSDTKSDGTPKTAAQSLLNGLYLDEDLSSPNTVPAGSGSATTPAALTDNTWGYAVDQNTTGAPTVWTTLSHQAMESATPTSDAFAAVPGKGSEDLIQTTNSANTSIPADSWTDDYFDDPTKYTAATIWYGARANMSAYSGAYSNTIAYSAIVQASPSGNTMSFNPSKYVRGATYENMTWSDTLTIKTSLLTSTSVDLGDNISVTISGNGPAGAVLTSCPVTSATVEPIEQGATSGYATIQCTLPQAYAATYTIVLNIPKFGETYTGTYEYATTWDTISLMQEMTADVCASAGPVTTTTYPVPERYLTDIRGGGGHITGSVTTGYTYNAAQNGKYRVRKLADGNCWMTENMDLAMATSQTYHSYDTNVSANWSPSNATITSAGQTESTRTADHSYRGNGSAGTTTATTFASTYAGHSIVSETQHIGTYYDWAAAIADRTDYTTAGDSVSTSICPKGWTLPKGNTDAKSFQTLANAYSLTNSQAGSEGLRSYPLSFVFSGNYYWGHGSLYYQSTGGHWWSSTVVSDTNSRSLYVYSSELRPQGNNNKLYGFGVRCVSL